MGAKTAILAFTDGDIRPALLGATRTDPVEAEGLVRHMFPGYQVTPVGEATLWNGTYPSDDITNVIALAGADLFCDQRLVIDRPSELPARFHDVAAGRRVIMHGMHSVVDWLCFAVWEDGRLVRSLSLSPRSGILENIGEPFDFERPFWAGEHPVEPESDDPYPLPFHPLELGEEALRALFGFVIEGYQNPDDLDADSVPLNGFRVTDPSGVEQADREAMYEQARQSFGQPRFFRRGPDGTLHEVSFDNL